MTPWEMILAHQYREAVDRYEQQLLDNPDDPDLLSAHGTGLLCLGRTTEALADFRRANVLATQRLKGESEPYINDIGCLLWIMGERQAALITFRKAVEGITRGSIKFADNAGGVSQGLLLWYAGVTSQDRDATQAALDYLKKLAKKPRMAYWPGQLAHLALGDKAQADVLREVSGTSLLDQAISAASADLLKRRELAKTLFYLAVQQRAQAHEMECKDLMTRCATLENPILEPEWYLARAEVCPYVETRRESLV